MLVQLDNALVLFEDASSMKVLCVEDGKVTGAAIHGQLLTEKVDYIVFPHTADGWQAMKEYCLRRCVTISSGPGAMVVDTVDELMEWVYHGEDSGVRGRAAKPTQSPSTEGADLYFTSLAEQSANDFGAGPDDEEWRRGPLPEAEVESVDEWLKGKAVVPHNRLTRWLGPSQG